MTSILLTQDYFFWSKVDGTAKAAGAIVAHAKTVDDVKKLSETPTAQLLIDLRHPEFVAAIQFCAEKKIPTIGFVSHTDAETIAKARAAGCDTVMAKSQFSRDLAVILQK